MDNRELADEIEHQAARTSAFSDAKLPVRLCYEIIAALRRSNPVLGECEECGHMIVTPLHHLPSVEKDAARYRKLKAAITVPYAMQSFIKHMNWHPDTFNMGIDEALDAALNESR